MKKQITIIVLAIFFATSLFAQNGVSISNGVSSPDPSAMLDIDALDKGLLIPRVTLVNLTSISPITVTPADGLLVYNKSIANGVAIGFYYWADNKWNKMIKNGDIWTQNGQNVFYNGGNVGIGTNTPTSILDVQSTTSGFIPPRMNETQKNNISSPTNGMIIYQTDGEEGLYVYNNNWELLQKKQKEYYLDFGSDVNISNPQIDIEYEPKNTFRITIQETGIYDIYANAYLYTSGIFVTQEARVFVVNTDESIGWKRGFYFSNNGESGSILSDVNIYSNNVSLQAGDIIGLKISGSKGTNGNATLSVLWIFNGFLRIVKKD